MNDTQLNPVSHQWWTGLDDEWKKIIQKKLDFKGTIPDDKLNMLAEADGFSISYAEITSLEPIKDFHKLEVLDISACYKLENLHHLPPNITYVTLHWLKFDDWEPLITHPKIEKVYADAAFQKSLNMKISRNKKKIILCKTNPL